MGDPILFVVRVWSDQGFRASVRHVESDDVRLFARAIDVACYLQQQSERASDVEDEERSP
jgi:hypothetical protein